MSDRTDSELGADLRGAAERGELLTHYQPQLDMGTRRIVAVEALARWLHPELGAVPPTTFIRAAEWAGVVDEVGDFIMREACRQMAAWRDRGIVIEMSINVSPDQLRTGDFSAALMATVLELELDPRAVTVEITESRPIADFATVLTSLRVLRAIGIGVSLDDFGAGYSSLTQLRSLPATEMKIDRSLITAGESGFAELSPVVVEAHEHGIRVVAEGIETDEQYSFAERLGCDRAQGYLIGRPASAEWLEEYVS